MRSSAAASAAASMSVSTGGASGCCAGAGGADVAESWLDLRGTGAEVEFGAPLVAFACVQPGRCAAAAEAKELWSQGRARRRGAL